MDILKQRVILPVRVSVLAVLWLCCLTVTAADTSRYQAPVDGSSWEAKGSVFECRLSHPIPFYGEAVFTHRAGVKAGFQLHSGVPKLAPGAAELSAVEPEWLPAAPDHPLGVVKVSAGAQPVTLGATDAARMLQHLFVGRQVVFSREAWFDPSAAQDVVISPVNFRDAYTRYQACQSELLPVNYEQVHRTSIYFAPGTNQLPERELNKLDNIATYIRADDSVKAFYVDGHTDSSGYRNDNFELSQERAELIVEMLVERGIARDRIVARWHGERYPVATNQTAAGRSLNRRVTVRLEKSEPVATAPSEASSSP